MKPPNQDINWVAVYVWVSQHLVYLAFFMLSVMGAVFAAIMGSVNDNLPIAKRGFVIFFSCLLMSFIESYIYDKWSITTILMLLGAGVLGIGAEKASNWVLEIWQKSSGFVDFLKRTLTIINLFRKAVNDLDAKPDADPTTKPPTG